MNSLPCEPEALDHFLAEPTPGAMATLARIPGDILVAGAGGKMGGTLSLMLAEAVRRAGGGRSVTAVSRFSDSRSRELLEAAGVRTVSANLLERSEVLALPEAAIVFFMAGQKFGTESTPAAAWAMNTLAPAHIAERYLRARIVAFSTGCVYSLTTAESGGSVEGSPTAPPGLYAHTCMGREGIFQWHALRHGTPVALVRLNYSVECRYGVLVDIGQRLLAGQPVDLTMGHVNLIWQRDACAHAIQCLEAAAVPAVPVNVTGAAILSVRILAEEMAARLGCRAAFTGTEGTHAWLNNAAWSHGRFGAPPTPLEDMLDWTAAWLRTGLHTLGKPTHFEAGDGKF